MAFAPDCKSVVSCGAGGVVCRWDVSAGKQLPAAQELDLPTALRVAVISPHGRLVATLTGGAVKLFPVPAPGAPKLDEVGLQALLDRRNSRTIRAGGPPSSPAVSPPKGEPVLTADADKPSPRERAVTLLAEMKGRFGGHSRLIGLGGDGKPRWQFDAGGVVTTAQMVGAERVLYALSGDPILIESDLTGKVLWRKKVTGDVGPNTICAAQRLSNGDTFCALDFRVVEIDPGGKEVVIARRKRVDGYGIMDARKLPNGHIGLLTSDGFFRLLDAQGKELKNLPVGRQQEFNGPGRLDVLPGGGVLVTHWNTQNVVEYDAEGKWVWEAKVKTPTSVSRLPNGNTLVTSQADQCAAELDRTGQVVWRYRGEGAVLLARRLLSSVPGQPAPR